MDEQQMFKDCNEAYEKAISDFSKVEELTYELWEKYGSKALDIFYVRVRENKEALGKRILDSITNQNLDAKTRAGAVDLSIYTEGRPKMKSILNRLALTDKDDEFRLLLLDHIGTYEIADERLIQIAKNKSEKSEIRIAAMAALTMSKIWNKEFVDVCIEAAKEKDEEIRKEAILDLGIIFTDKEDKEVISLICDILRKDKVTTVRTTAVRALADIGSPLAVPALEAQRKVEKSGLVLREIYNAMIRIGLREKEMKEKLMKIGK